MASDELLEMSGYSKKEIENFNKNENLDKLKLLLFTKDNLIELIKSVNLDSISEEKVIKMINNLYD